MAYKITKIASNDPIADYLEKRQSQVVRTELPELKETETPVKIEPLPDLIVKPKLYNPKTLNSEQPANPKTKSLFTQYYKDKTLTKIAPQDISKGFPTWQQKLERGQYNNDILTIGAIVAALVFITAVTLLIRKRYNGSVYKFIRSPWFFWPVVIVIGAAVLEWTQKTYFSVYEFAVFAIAIYFLRFHLYGFILSILPDDENKKDT